MTDDTPGAGRTATATLICDFCAHRCRIAPGGRGRCGVRANVDGTLVTTVRDQVHAFALDPIEKKPLYHVRPGTQIASVALGGCNFTCQFCQNSSIAFAHELREPRIVASPAEIAARAAETNSLGLAFTYDEPAVWQDWLIEAANAFRGAGAELEAGGTTEAGASRRYTVMVTNGFLTPESVARLAPAVDAFNIDLKGDDDFYRELCGAALNPVVETIVALAARRHVEVTTMIVGSRHTSELLTRFAALLREAGVDVWHLSRFFPAHLMLDTPATTDSELADALRTLDALTARPRWLYAGNSRLVGYRDTRCAGCGSLLIERGAGVIDHTGGTGRCPSCGEQLPGLW